MIQFAEIGESDVQNWVGDAAFQRGYQYYEDEAILNPRRRGQSLIAECQGSQAAPYRVEIRLGSDGILDGSCTCPAGDGGHCKHAAALLLTWIHETEFFIEVPELDQMLEERSKEELISLIQNMVARHPDLEQMLELSTLSSLPVGEILKPDLIVQQIRRSFSSAGGELGDHVRIADNLQVILDLGEDFIDREDIRNAAIVYETLMEGLLANEDLLYHDQGGELGEVLAECEQGLQDCISSAIDPELRQGLLHTLLDLFLWDLQAGGLGFADETPSILASQASPAEKQMIARWIQEEIPGGASWDSEYQRRALGGLWLTLLSSSLDDETYLRICRETGRNQDMIDRLLNLGRVDEALVAARQASGNITVLADLFEEHGFPQLGMLLVNEQAGGESDVQRLEWLKQYALRHNMPGEALHLAETLFWQAQSLENYNDLLEAAESPGVDQPVSIREIRGRVLERLESAGNFSLLVEIYLLENEIDLALAALERVNPDIWGERLAVLRRQVAQAVEVTRPREAIRQYLLLAEDLIEQRSRGSYAEAVIFLQRVKRLYQALGEQGYSEQIIQSLRNEYHRLPDLLDEMRRAGL